MTSILNIAALTRRTGVPADTIRKWEQRYGVLSPERTAGGQRRYSELDVARVEWLKARLAEGYRIGEAAALLGDGGMAPASPEELRDAFARAAEAGDVSALRSAVEQALALRTLEEAFTEVLGPALADIGVRWQRGELSVAQEHLASGTVRSALQRLLADARATVRGLAVLACAPGERHEIGLLMFAVLMRADGWQVAYLGADTPFADAVSLATTLNADALCFSATAPKTASALKREIDKKRFPPHLSVVVGGQAGGADLHASIASLRKRAA